MYQNGIACYVFIIYSHCEAKAITKILLEFPYHFKLTTQPPATFRGLFFKGSVVKHRKIIRFTETRVHIKKNVKHSAPSSLGGKCCADWAPVQQVAVQPAVPSVSSYSHRGWQPQPRSKGWHPVTSAGRAQRRFSLTCCSQSSHGSVNARLWLSTQGSFWASPVRDHSVTGWDEGWLPLAAGTDRQRDPIFDLGRSSVWKRTTFRHRYLPSYL